MLDSLNARPVNSSVRCLLARRKVINRQTLKRLILAALVITAFTASSDRICGQGDLRYLPDTLSVEDPRMQTYYEIDGQLLSLFSVSGRRSLSQGKVGSISIYHVILLYPEEPTTAVAWNGKGEGAVWAHFVRWIIQRGSAPDDEAREIKSLELKFDVAEKSLTIGTEKFYLSSGNIFIVRLHEGWFPLVTQFPARFTKSGEGEQVLKFMKSLSKTQELLPELDQFR